MATRNLAVHVEIVPAWKSLLGEMLPSRGDATRLSDAHRTVTGSSRKRSAKDDGRAVWMRKILSPDNRFRPRPETVVELSDAIRGAIDVRLRQRWFAAPLALFAAGYFSEYLFILYHATASGGLQINRCQQLVRHTAVALEQSPFVAEIESYENAAREMRARIVGRSSAARELETEAQNLVSEADELRKRLATRPDRAVWTCTDAEHRAFEKAWRHRHTTRGNAPLVCMALNDEHLAAASLAEHHPEIGLTRQRAITVNAMSLWLAREHARRRRG